MQKVHYRSWSKSWPNTQQREFSHFHLHFVFTSPSLEHPQNNTSFLIYLSSSLFHSHPPAAPAAHPMQLFTQMSLLFLSAHPKCLLLPLCFSRPMLPEKRSFPFMSGESDVSMTSAPALAVCVAPIPFLTSLTPPRVSLIPTASSSSSSSFLPLASFCSFALQGDF